MKKKPFDFRWKLTENYFNAFMVFFFTIAVAHSIINKDYGLMTFALIMGLIFPLFATLIDLKSHQNPNKK